MKEVYYALPKIASVRFLTFGVVSPKREPGAMTTVETLDGRWNRHAGALPKLPVADETSRRIMEQAFKVACLSLLYELHNSVAALSR